MKISELPCDLLEEIFCGVPAASLLRLRTTCKQWNLLFKDREFSRKHSDKATKQFGVLLLTREARVCLVNVNLHNGTPCAAEVTSERSLFDNHSNSNHQKINRVFHCDGLLITSLCTIGTEAVIVICNPFTGETKWIQTGQSRRYANFVLGYSQDNKACNKSYKILSYEEYTSKKQDFGIYDISSNSWKKLHVTPPDLEYRIVDSFHRVSLKGKTYWLAFYEIRLVLISFDYTRERFERLCLPYKCMSIGFSFTSHSISVVGEDKLSVLLQRPNTSITEIWVTNKIDDETKKMSWTNLLQVEVSNTRLIKSFFVDEEKKIVVCSEKCRDNGHLVIRVVSIVGQVAEFRVERPWELVLGNFVPSLNQIPQFRGKPKRKRIKADNRK